MTNKPSGLSVRHSLGVDLLLCSGKGRNKRTCHCLLKPQPIKPVTVDCNSEAILASVIGRSHVFLLGIAEAKLNNNYNLVLAFDLSSLRSIVFVVVGGA